MSNMKGGFSTLNRWFGRKKDKSGVAANGKLSKSTTQLHHLSTDTGMHINEASQLDYNRITPLPAVTSNAPFEQTFRITVLLPKDQLYVTRLGARVPLSKLLSLVCDNKQLDADKYEFRNPVDASQVFSCESSIGAVGLSEIRLCHKSESYDSFNADSMLKFQRTVAGRDSLSSSSDFSSSRHSQSKLTAKTPSPYSSSNSLNSMDSTGMNYTRTPVVVPPKVLAVAPPPRKKRVAPRPPSQGAIPEQSVAQFTPTTTARPAEPAYAVIVKRPQLCMSTPNLASTPELEPQQEEERQLKLEIELDCNGNSAKTPDASDGGHYATLDIKSLPEPTPRKRLVQLKKKAAPAPPPEALGGGGGGGAAAADSISLASTTASITEMLAVTQPQPAPRITTPSPAMPQETPPPALPNSAAPQLSNNVSKVLLNRTPTPEPRSLSSANEEEYNNDAASKQADSGIGDPANSVTPSPEPERESERELERESEREPEREPELELQLDLSNNKSQLDSSSDDEEAIKVYNFKTSCQSSIKTQTQTQTQQLLPAPTTLAELSVLTAQQSEDEQEEQPSPLANDATLATPNSASELTSLSSWNYAVPISPPPDFSDLSKNCSTPLDEIVDELSSIIQQQRLDTLIRQAPEQPQIEAAKPNRLANFSIAAIGNSNGHGLTNGGNTRCSSSCSSASSPTITRADSFQTLPQSSRALNLGLRLRSSSQLSLNKLEQLSSLQQQRRSSSELSIAESPSLQSLELIKTILSNSRKNSLAGSATDQTDQSEKPKSKTPVNTPVASPVCSPVASPVGSPVTSAVSPAVVSSVASPVTSPVASPVTPPVASKTTAAPIKSSPFSSPNASAERSSPTTASPAPTPAASQPEPATKPLPPTYRYSGPPSINFATWSERPKSHVAIKNEGDYIFGGASPGAAVPTAPATAPAKLTIEIASPILRMGIPRKEYHVPITVKPLRDASQEREKDQQLEKQQQEQQPLERKPEKPTTLPRPTKSNRYTLPAGGGIQISNQLTLSTTMSNSLPRPVSTLERTTTTTTEPIPAPFGQNTLRRTGFKERMLAKELEEKEQALRVRVSVNGTPTATPTSPTTAAKPVLQAKTVMKSSKLQLKLQQQPETEAKAEAQMVTPTAQMVAQTAEIVTPKAQIVTPTAQKVTPTAPMLQVKLRPSSQNLTNKSTATPTPPPPPALPTLTKAKTTKRSSNLVTPTTPDPRTQLLDAIRNFKREELNRA